MHWNTISTQPSTHYTPMFHEEHLSVANAYRTDCALLQQLLIESLDLTLRNLESNQVQEVNDATSNFRLWCREI